MELYILNDDFEIIKYLNDYISLEWVRRYFDVGDFVLSTIAKMENMSALLHGSYIAREDCGSIMVIETIPALKTSLTEPNTITVSGRSIESLLDRRIVWEQTTSKASETAETFIRRLVSENCINPTDTKRKIPRLKLGALNGFPETIDKQVTGDNLLTVIKETCVNYGYGFKIHIDEGGNLVFDLYKGKDRSYNQIENPYVTFSNDYGNLVNTEYSYDKSNYKNVALIGGEGEGTERKYRTVGDAQGLDRYELFVDAKDISSNNGEIELAEYNKLLDERGYEELEEQQIIEEFTGEVEATRMYRYKEHYDLGDIVQVENEYEISASPRILEVIESQNENGYRVVPTFGAWEV